jgi:CRP-like cAMP-binding protein
MMSNSRTSGAKAVSSPVGLRSDLVLGRRELSVRFRSSPTRTLPARELLSSGARSEHLIYHLEAGWAYQFRDLPDGRRAIFDIYLPGDVVGLDALLQIRPLHEVMTLTSIKIRAIHTEEAVNNLIGSRAVSLYMVWLLAQRQRRADHHLVALACHDGRARLASMLVAFYKLLLRRRLITAPYYHLPLTQIQMGSYLGLNVVHVNRVLRFLREEQIAVLDKHCVTILDLERLRNLVHRAMAVTLTACNGDRVLSEIALSEGPQAAD